MTTVLGVAVGDGVGVLNDVKGREGKHYCFVVNVCALYYTVILYIEI